MTHPLCQLQVVDEADTMLADKTWAAELRTILGPLRARPDRPKAGVVLVSATMSKVRGIAARAWLIPPVAFEGCYEHVLVGVVCWWQPP